MLQELRLPFGQGFRFSRLWFTKYHKRAGQNVTLRGDEYKLYTYEVSNCSNTCSSFVCSFVYSCNNSSNDLSVGPKDLDSNCTVQYCTEQYNSYYPGREHHAENKENFFFVYQQKRYMPTHQKHPGLFRAMHRRLLSLEMLQPSRTYRKKKTSVVVHLTRLQTA